MTRLDRVSNTGTQQTRLQLALNSGAGLLTNVDRLWPSRTRVQGEGIETRRGRQRVRGRPKGNRASIPEPRRGDFPGRAYAPRFARRLAHRRAGAVRPGQAATQTPSETMNRTPGRAIFSW